MEVNKMWTKDEKSKTRWWNHGTNRRTTLVVDVWQYAPNLWRASVNNSWLAKDMPKQIALKEAKKYMLMVR